MDLQFNYPFQLELAVGSDCDSSQGCSEGYESILIGSDIPPRQLGSHSDPETGNGSVIRKAWYLVVQGQMPIIIEETEEDHYYGFSWKSGEKSYRAFPLPEEIKVDFLCPEEEEKAA